MAASWSNSTPENSNGTVNSSFDKAILMSSSDTLTEFVSLADTSNMLHNIDEANNSEGCRTVYEFTNNSIEECSIYQHLTMIEKSLNEQEKDSQSQKRDTIGILREYYDKSPERFTEHLLTIIEESIIDYFEDSDSSLATNYSTLTNSPLFTFNGNDSSTLYRSFEKFFKQQQTAIYPKTPFIVTNAEKSWETNSTSCTPYSEEDTRDNIPNIIVDPGTPGPTRIRRMNNSQALSPNEDDNDEYLTAESEIEASPTKTIVTEESGSSLNEKTINMSNVARRHEKWIKTYEKLAACQSRKADFEKRIAQRNVRVADHADKLERKIFEKLAIKRAACLKSINILLENAALRSKECENNIAKTPLCLTCENCKRRIQFHNTMMACSEYFTCAKNSRDTLITKTHNRRRSGEKSPITPRKDSNNNTPNSATRRSIQLGKRMSKKKRSPGATLVVNPRRRSGGLISPVNRRSQNIKRKIAASKTPSVDRSSIRPVSQLRQLFSPRATTPETRIPLPITQGSKNYVSKVTIQTTTPLSAKSSVSSVTKKKFKHVKSPVLEYIRGNKLPMCGKKKL